MRPLLSFSKLARVKFQEELRVVEMRSSCRFEGRRRSIVDVEGDGRGEGDAATVVGIDGEGRERRAGVGLLSLA